MTELRNKLEKQQKLVNKLFFMIESVLPDTSYDTVLEVGDEKEELFDGVMFMKCSLSNDLVSVVNVEFDNGRIPTRKYEDRHLYIYVIDGYIYDEYNSIVKKEGEVYKIPAGTLHSLYSEYARVTITFKPPYDLVEKILTE